MAPVPTGTLLVRMLADDTRAFYLRVRIGAKRERVILHERPGCVWLRRRMGRAGGAHRAGQHPRPGAGRVWAAARTAARASPRDGCSRRPDLPRLASWLVAGQDRRCLGDKPIADNTAADYRWRLRRHLLPVLRRTYRLDEIDRELCLAFKAHKLREARELREALAAGADMRDRRGRRRVPLGPASIRKLIDGLAAHPRRRDRGRPRRAQPGARQADARPRPEAQSARSSRWTSWPRCSTLPPSRTPRWASAAVPRDLGPPRASWSPGCSRRASGPTQIARELGVAKSHGQLPSAPTRRRAWAAATSAGA